MSQKPPIFIQFAGQGVKFMDELRRLYTTYPAIQPFIQEAARVVQTEASQYDDSETGFFRQGVDVMSWIEKPETTPEMGYLLSSPLSHPFIYLCQVGNYLSILREGVDPRILLENTHSITGFSTGVIAAIVTSIGTTIEKVEELGLKVIAMFFWQGVRCQQSMFKFGASDILRTDLVDSREGSPACMAAIGNLDRDKLKGYIAEFADYGVVHLAYGLANDRNIIAGLQQSLSAFSLFIKEREPRSSWRYTPSTIAAHCPFLRYSLETSPQDAERIGLSFNAQDMVTPVWSNDTGEDIRNHEDIVWEVMKAYFTKPAFWDDQIHPLLAPDASGISYVLDFGPGTGVASLTEGYTKGMDIQVIRCVVPLGRKKLIEEIMPALSAGN